MFLGRAYFDYFFTIVACLTVLERVATQQWAERNEDVTESPLTDVRGSVDSVRYRPATVRCATAPLGIFPSRDGHGAVSPIFSPLLTERSVPHGGMAVEGI
jgi:hypothetical protein